MKIESILTELGNQMNLPNLKLDDNKVCRLIFDKKFTVDIEASEDLKTVHLYSALCIIPPRDKENLYEALLEANLFGRGTGINASFGLDLEMGEILLSLTFKDMDKVDYQDFVNALESFVNHVEAWTDKIDKGEYSRDRRAAPPPSPGSEKKSAPARPDEAPPPGFIRA